MTPLLEELTCREEQVLLLIGDGLGLREIAERLAISWWTARNHRDRARAKLRASTTTQAAVMVARLRDEAALA